MSGLKYLFFLGCVIPYRVLSYEVSARKVLEKLGVELIDMPSYNCCGLPLDPVHHDMALALSARNLCIAEHHNLNILTLCNGCFSMLNEVNKQLKESRDLRDRVNGYLKEVDMEFKGTIEVKHLVHVLVQDVGFNRIKEHIVKPFNGFRVASHSGCHLLRPSKYVGFDDPENPRALKSLIELTGAECIDYIDEVECCGGPIISIDDGIPLQLARKKLHRVKDAGAKALITVCPFCHTMYDVNQPRIERVFDEKIGLPVLHYTQMLGLAMGMGPDELALNELRVKPKGLFL